MDDRTTEEEEAEQDKHHGAGGQDGTAQGLVDGAVDDFCKGPFAILMQIFADAVEDDDGVIHIEAHQGEEGGNHFEGNFLIRQRKDGHDKEDIMGQRDHRSERIRQLQEPAEQEQEE